LHDESNFNRRYSIRPARIPEGVFFLAMSQEKQILLEQGELGRTLSRMAHEVVEKTTNSDELVLIGIRSRGVHLARRMARKIETLAKTNPPVGVIDISQYRDDRAHDVSSAATIPFEVLVSVDDKTVVLVDDVIFRGRTIRAAMEAVSRLGQPKRILVAVLIDRGARELPIRADIVGKNVEAGKEERINVMLEESDGIDQVALVPWQTKSPV
jgi:pyrimidine operon attenuation protein / uracil phosphoribosyltransferase